MINAMKFTSNTLVTKVECFGSRPWNLTIVCAILLRSFVLFFFKLVLVQIRSVYANSPLHLDWSHLNFSYVARQSLRTFVVGVSRGIQSSVWMSENVHSIKMCPRILRFISHTSLRSWENRAPRSKQFKLFVVQSHRSMNNLPNWWKSFAYNLQTWRRKCFCRAIGCSGHQGVITNRFLAV